ncbi:MAG: S8 family peptidase [Chthoniobacterales bacterium]
MKLPRHRIYFLAGLLLLVLAALLAGDSWNTSSIKQASFSLKKPSQQLSLVAQQQLGKIKKKSANLVQKREQSTKADFIRLHSSLPAPLNALSAEELHEFPGGRVVEVAEVPGPDLNETTRVRILQTQFKYPAIRTEEVIDKTTGDLLAREEMIADHLLVTLKSEEDPEKFLKNFGPSAKAMIRVTSDAPLYRLELSSATASSLPEAMNAIASAGDATVASEPDFIVHGCAIPNDPAMQPYRFFETNYQWGLYKIDAPKAWNVRTSAPSVIVAVVDCGIRYTHEDLAANMWHNPAPTNNDIYGWNAYANTGDPMDHYGHGTFCAGIIGAVGNNGLGITGVAQKVQLMACKYGADISNLGVNSDVIVSVDYACDHGANIISCSFASPNYAFSTNYTDSIFSSFQRAHDKGVIVVAAVANNSQDCSLYPMYPANYPLDNIVSVAATTKNDTIASFSNYGTNVAIAAPGVSIYSTWADSDSSYAIGDGTSAAAPYVAGSLALMMAQFPKETYQELIARLYATADNVPALRGKVEHGRLNLAKALGYTPSSYLTSRFDAFYDWY